MAVQEVTIFDASTGFLPKDSTSLQKRTNAMGVSEPSLGLEKQVSSPAYREVTNYIVQSYSCQIRKTGAAPRSAEQLGADASGHLVTPVIFNDTEYLSRSNALRTVFVVLVSILQT